MRCCLVALTLILSSCAFNVSDPREIHGINPVFDPLVQKFEAFLGHSIGDIPIQFYPQDGTAGVCEIWTGSAFFRDIKIDENFWNRADDSAREQLIFHELGHCALNRAHVINSFITNGRLIEPTSYMWPQIFVTNYLSFLLPYYESELFTINSNTPMLYGSANELDSLSCIKRRHYESQN